MGATPVGQQRRLMRLSPSHGDVLLALNNSAIYVGVAAGAAAGGAILRYDLGLDRIPLASSLLLVLAGLVYCASLLLHSYRAGDPLRDDHATPVRPETYPPASSPRPDVGERQG